MTEPRVRREATQSDESAAAARGRILVASPDAPLLSAEGMAACCEVTTDTLAALTAAGLPSYRIAGRLRYDAREVGLWLGDRPGWPLAAARGVALPPAPPGRREGFVYFIGTAARTPIKVGWAADPRRRLGDLQAACWHELVVHGAFPGTQADEALAHRALATHRLRGEWFRRTPALRYLRIQQRRAPDNAECGTDTHGREATP